MKMNLDDPKLTAYALDELGGAEKAAMEAALSASPEAQEFVSEVRLLSADLRAEYEIERETQPMAPGNIVPLEQKDEPWSISRRLALAATIALCACLGAVAIGTMKRNGLARKQGYALGGPVAQPAENAVEAVESPMAASEEPPPPPPAAPTHLASTPQTDVLPKPRAKVASADGAAAKAERVIATASNIPTAETETALPSAAAPSLPNTARYRSITDNSFLKAASNPLSTFSIDVDTASYANVRRFLESGSLPPKDAVRIEEMINYFHYDYPQPDGDAPFSINLDAAGCPWAPSHRLVRIGLQGKELPNEKRPPSNLVFLLDVSGSMEPENRLPLVKQAMRMLVGKLGEKDRVAIVVYSGASGLALPPTSGDQKERILNAIETLQVSGSTNGAQGIGLAYQTAARNFIKGGVNRVILATDGDFNVGATSDGELIRLIQEKAKSGVFLSVLGVGDDNLNDAMMQQLADKGNGNYAYLDSLGEAEKVLVRQINGTLTTIAKDVKIQVEFNPAEVASYRLIGYEKRLLRKEDFNNDKIDAGEIGAGHSVNALYEIAPAGQPVPGTPPAVDPLKYGPDGAVARLAETPAPALTESPKGGSPELLTVKMRHKAPDGDKSERSYEVALVDQGAAGDYAKASADFKFSAAVASFGMILRESAYKGNATLGSTLDLAQEGKGPDASGYRAGFIELVHRAQALRADD